MKRVKLPLWLQHFVAVMGGGGICLVAFLDSSVLSFPFITDALVMRQCMEHPSRTLYYAAMATLGSLLGCIWIYWLAKKGGEAYFHRHGGRAALKAKRWVDDHAFLSLFIPAILPPPMQFKVFVLAEGVFQVPLRTFVLALVLGRGFRYVAEGLFAVKYGQQALDFLIAHAVTFTLAVVIVMVLMYFANKFLLHTAPAADSD
jgi:membrane protein YqaA with SNARE-associated domain